MAIDARVFSKAVQESTQLPSNIPGVVVIDMSRTTARPRDWAEEIHQMIAPGLYNKMSAVWLRSGAIGNAGIDWKEFLISNPFATLSLDKEIIELILPSVREIDLSGESSKRMVCRGMDAS